MFDVSHSRLAINNVHRETFYYSLLNSRGAVGDVFIGRCIIYFCWLSFTLKVWRRILNRIICHDCNNRRVCQLRNVHKSVSFALGIIHNYIVLCLPQQVLTASRMQHLALSNNYDIQLDAIKNPNIYTSVRFKWTWTWNWTWIICLASCL